MSKITKIKGFADLFPPDSDVFTRMESVARQVFGRYGFVELRIPILERTDLFCRSIGTETDVVQKEMYTFPDRKDRSLTLRPEATAGVMRAFIESGRHGQEPVSKLFSYGPMFRYERPQKGRMRQFHQINCEVLGPDEPHADAELMLMLMRFLTELGLTGLSLQVNSLGCKECRPVYRKALSDFLASIDNEALCDDCRRRMETNPLRVLDCKVPTCRELTAGAPTILEHNCPSCRSHFDAVLRILDARAVPYVLNDRLVRGLDYYNRTTFEVVSDSIGSQGSVAGGGRYDGLIAQLGGPDVPGVGFACGMERLAMMMPPLEAPRPDFHVAVLDPEAQDAALLLAEELRQHGLAGEVGFGSGSIKSRMRLAGKSRARKCLILGGDELANATVVVKDMDSGAQESVRRDAIAAHVLTAGA